VDRGKAKVDHSVQVLPSTLRHAVKVQVPYFEFDGRLKAYFKKTETYLAEDQVSGHHRMKV
jgi:hypothetical protein